MVCLSTIVLQQKIRLKSALEHLSQQYYYVPNNNAAKSKRLLVLKGWAFYGGEGELFRTTKTMPLYPE